MAVLAINGGEKVRTKGWPSWPIWDEREIKAVEDTVRSGRWGRIGENTQTEKFEQVFAEYQDAKYGIAVTSGTAALTIALKAVGVDIGDEVIVPPYTFIASATSILQNNAVPIFVDIELETRNIDPDAIEAAITPRTTAIMPVHFSGRACDMERILEIAKRHDLAIVEDAAHCWGATWNDRKLGAVGDIGGISFQASKHLNCGEGGIILTNDEELAAKAFSFHHIGRLPGRPFYEHHFIGWNFRITEFQSAVLLAQFERLEDQTQRRHENGLYLDEKLDQIDGLRALRRDPFMTRIARHAFCLLYDEETVGVPREKFMAAVSAEGVGCGGGYPHPLYKNPLFTEKRFGRITEMVEYPDYADMYLPNCEKICDIVVWLGQTMLLGTREDMDDIVAAFEKVAENVDELR